MAHPYSPQSAAIPGYAPNVTPILHLAAAFASLAGGVIGTALLIARQKYFWYRLRSIDVFAIGWFALCGFLHCCFESEREIVPPERWKLARVVVLTSISRLGYFVYYQGRLAGMQTLFAQLWKYYSLADSRYIALDNFTVCIEFLTALIWGPMCLLTVYTILAQSPSRHILQIIVSVAHIYGVLLYFGTEYRNELITGDSSSLPDFLFYWVYYVGFNVVWAIVPAYLLCDSWKAITSVFTECEAKAQNRKGQ